VWKAARPGNLILTGSGLGIGGYSPFNIHAFRENLCQNYFSSLNCDDLPERLTRPVAPTGRTLLDLAGVDELVLADRGAVDAFRARGLNWAESQGPYGEWRLKRGQTSALVTWATPGADVRVVEQAAARIRLQVSNPGSEPALVVLGRAWYPGWRARLGDQAVRVVPVAGLLVAVEAPPGATGELRLEFRPPALRFGAFLALLGVLGLAGAQLWPLLMRSPLGSRILSVSSLGRASLSPKPRPR
jgi:hypothetical protein